MPGEEAGQAARAGLHAALGQGVAQLVQEDRRPRLVARQDQFGLRLDPVRYLIATRRLGREPPILAELFRPATGTGHADTEPGCRLMTGGPLQNGRDDTLAQIDGQR